MKAAFLNSQNYFFSKNPILIIDRDGLIGEPLALKLSKEFLVVYVSQKKPDTDVENQNIIHMPFFKKNPAIPDSKYSHIVFIDEEGEDLEFLPKLIKKSKDVNSDFIFAQGLSSKEEFITDKVLHLYSSAKVVLFGDIFDNKLIFKKANFKSVINKLIYQAQRFGKMQVLGEGLRDVYPVLLKDVVDGLIDLIFGIHKSGSLFYVFPKYPPTELSLAHMIQKSNPEIMVDFVKHDPRSSNITYSPNGKYLLGDKYPLAKKIRAIDIQKEVKGENEDHQRKNGKKLRKYPLFLIWTLIFLLISPFVFTMFFSFLGLNTFYYAKSELNKGNFANAKSSIHLSQTFFYIGKQASDILTFQARLVNAESYSNKFSQDIDLGYKISEVLTQAFNAKVYLTKVLNGGSKNPKEDFTKGKNYLKSSIIALNNIKAEGKIFAQILQNVEVANPLIKLLSTTEDVLSSILGIEEPKTYLILFQDNMELRPGGGIINFYGILKFNQGKITQFEMHNVNDADSQLKGHAEPPFALRRYLSEKHWYMKDSNFDVDFVESALSSSNFLFVETGYKPDGVIAVDYTFVKNILHVIGPVYVADYKQAVDENNFYNLMQSYAQKDFLISLNRAIITKVRADEASYLLIAQVISDALLQKHLLLTFDDMPNIFTVNGWSSSLWDERREISESVDDFVGINEANMGLNKANYFLKRQIAQKVAIQDNGNIAEELTISYRNESTVWPGGDYLNYLRIILPENTSLSEISINDKVQDLADAIVDPLIYEAKNFKVPKGLEIEKVKQDNKAIFGFMIKIPSQENVKVKLKYVLNKKILGLDTFSYNLKLFKQPGVDNLPYSFSFTYPNSFNFINGSNGVIKKGNEVSYSEKIVADKNVIMNFTRSK